MYNILLADDDLSDCLLFSDALEELPVSARLTIVHNGEELIEELKSKYTIVIVTHNMQQAARVSDVTAFFYLGELIEVGGTRKIFTNPEKKQTEDYITGRFG